MSPYLEVLGIAQDGGHPQTGCWRPCCEGAWAAGGHLVSCLGLVDPEHDRRFLVEATPDLRAQLHALGRPAAGRPALDGVLLTHAHIGHYTGLIHLGKEALNGQQIPVYAMPRMSAFLQSDAPWRLLVEEGSVVLVPLADGVRTQLTPNLAVIPFLVPHRGPLTETVGYRIEGPERSALFIPDIDSWAPWERSVADVVSSVDLAFLDATFYSADELRSRGRSMDKVGHPLVPDSMDRLTEQASRVRFIHINHTNPLLDAQSAEMQEVLARGFAVAAEGERHTL